MTRTFRCLPGLALLALLPGFRAGAQSGPAPSAQLARLSTVLGAWNVDDTWQPPGARAIRDVGVRTCAYALMQRYIECTTRSRNPETGREREYRWFINYNTETRRYDLVGIFSNYAGKVTQTFHVDSASGAWYIRSPSHTSDGVETWSWAQLTFDGPDRATWTAYRNRDHEPHDRWVVTARETWVRQR